MGNKNKKFFYLLPLSLVSFFSTLTIPTLSTSIINIEKINIDTNYLSKSEIANNTNTNWLNGVSVPSNYASFKPIAVTDGSQLITTNKGYIGISNDSKHLYCTSYSGYMIWSLNLTNNPFLQKFYNENQMTIDNITIQQWNYDKQKNVILVLLGDETNLNQSIVAIDANNGLFYNPVVDDEYNITKAPILKISNGKTKYNRIFKLSNNEFILVSIGNYEQYKNALKISLTNTGINANDFIIPIKNIDNTDILISIINGINCNFLVYIDSTAANSKDFDQYILVVDNNFNLLNSEKLILNNKFTSTSSVNNSFISYHFYKAINDNLEVYFVSGNSNNRYINKIIYNTKSKNLTQSQAVDLKGNEINNLDYDEKFNVLYIANSSSISNELFGMIDLNQTSLSYTSIVNSATEFSRECYVFALKENLSDNKKQILLYLDQYGNMTYISKNSNDMFFVPSKINLPLYGWNADSFYKKIKDSNFVKNIMQTSVNINTVKNYLIPNSPDWNVNLSYSRINYNERYGTLHFVINVSYNWAFDLSIKSSFSIPIYLNGFYKINEENFNFKFVSSSQDNLEKFSEIEKLKKSKFAKDVTLDEVYNYFWIGKVKDKNMQEIPITKEMFSIDGNFGDLSTLNVSLKLPSSRMPEGFDSKKLNPSFSYTGFLSTNGFEVNVKNFDQINAFAETIYPSQLTADDVIKNFLDIGSKIYKDLNYWEYTVHEVNDYEGYIIISLSYKYNDVGNIPNVENFPIQRFDVFKNIKISSFKKLSTHFNNIKKPYFKDFSSEYLPSEIWNQYIAYQNNETNNSFLLDNLTFDFLASKNDFIIELINPKTCDADKYLKLNLQIKENAVLNIEYFGNQYKKTNNNYLIFSNELIANISLEMYKFENLNFNISTESKYFEIINPNGEFIIHNNNQYIINLKDFNDGDFIISANQYAKDIDKETIKKLIKSKGYNYDFKRFQINNKKGYIVAEMQLQLSTPPIFDNNNQNDDDYNNLTRTLIIYNFKIPEPKGIGIWKIIILSISLTIIVFMSLWTSIWYLKKKRFNKLSSNKEIEEEKHKKQKAIFKKYKITNDIKKRNKK